MQVWCEGAENASWRADLAESTTYEELLGCLVFRLLECEHAILAC